MRICEFTFTIIYIIPTLFAYILAASLHPFTFLMSCFIIGMHYGFRQLLEAGIDMFVMNALIENAALNSQIRFVWSNNKVLKYCIVYCIPMHSDTCAQARGSQVTHDLYVNVPKLIISSNSIRLLNIVGQGILTI